MERTDKKILITGGSGFLGSRLCAYFRREAFGGKYRVLAPGHGQLDITDMENVRAYFAEAQPDILVHCAAISDVGESERKPELSYRVNVTGVENLARECAACDVKMVFCSSDQIYYGEAEMIPGGKAHTEEEGAVPRNTYGRQKLEAERRMLELCPDAVCLRLSWLYDTKCCSEKEHGNFYVNVKAALATEEVCTFPIYDMRGITYVGEILQNMPKVFALPGGVYNYGAENTLCTYELVKSLFRAVGIDERMVMPNRSAFADRPRNLSMDISRIRRFDIDFVPTLEMLVRMWR